MASKQPTEIKAGTKNLISLDTFICAFAVCVSAVFISGKESLWRILLCAVLSVVFDISAIKLSGKKQELDRLDSLAQGMITALLLPYNVPFYVCVTALAVSVFVAKLPFGGKNNAPFVPSAVGICFVYLLFSSECFNFGDTTISEMLSSGDAISINVFSTSGILCGNYPGAMGTVAMLPLIGVAAYMLIKQRRKFLCFAGFVLASSVFAVLLPRISGSAFVSLIMELSAGSLIFTALFLLPESIFLPQENSKSMLFGAFAGCICMLLRYVSPLPDSAPFGVMLLCALWPLISFRKTKVKTKEAKKKAVKENE